MSNGPNLLKDKFKPNHNNLFLYLIFIFISLVISLTILLFNRYNSYSYVPVESEAVEVKEDIKKEVKEDQPVEEDKYKAALIYPLGNLPITGELKISGIVEQRLDNLYLETTFRKKVNFPDYGTEFNIINFEPGKIKDIGGLNFFLGNKKMSNVYGFAQWPQILCDLKYDTYEKCINSKKDNIPPVVYFIKTTDIPESGREEFSIELDLGALSKTLYKKDINFEYNSEIRQLDSIDSCSLGYFYEKDYLSVPPVKNNYIGYRVSFPKDKSAGKVSENSVYIKFENVLYDLVVPDTNELIGYATRKKEYTAKDSYKGLYLPLDLLFYKNGEKANVLITQREYYSGEYFEYFPVSRITLQDLPEKISRSTASWSGCDG